MPDALLCVVTSCFKNHPRCEGCGALRRAAGLVILLLLSLWTRLVAAEPRIVTVDLGGEGLLGLTSILARNDLGDFLLSTLATPRSALLVRHTGNELVIQCPGAVGTVAHGVNNRGTVVGSCQTAAGVRRGFLRVAPSGAYLTLHVPGAMSTQALGLNDRQQVVGDFRDAAGMIHGFRWQNNHFTTVDAPFPGTGLTTLLGINTADQIVGIAVTDSGWAQGFLLQGETFTPLAVPGAFETMPFDINDNGLIVGTVRTVDQGLQTFVYDGVQYATLAVPEPEVAMTDLVSVTTTEVYSGRILVATDTPEVSTSRGVMVSGVALLPVPDQPDAPRADAPDPQRWCGARGPAKLAAMGWCEARH